MGKGIYTIFHDFRLKYWLFRLKIDIFSLVSKVLASTPNVRFIMFLKSPHYTGFMLKITLFKNLKIQVFTDL